MSKTISGVASGLAGNLAGNATRGHATDALLPVGGFDLAPSLAAAGAGLVGAFLTKGKLLSGVVSGVAGDGVAQLATNLYNKRQSGDIPGISFVLAGLAITAGIGVTHILG